MNHDYRDSSSFLLSSKLFIINIIVYSTIFFVTHICFFVTLSMHIVDCISDDSMVMPYLMSCVEDEMGSGMSMPAPLGKYCAIPCPFHV